MKPACIASFIPYAEYTSMTKIADFTERELALDPNQSFIVQAPAGSGKTELLSQRFLVLLSQVTQPEEILAITFTKKSAAEMRSRILSALEKCDIKPESEHEEKTRNIAKKALEHSIKFKWNLLENPNRLQIQTIDSLNASLTRQLPLLSQFGAPTTIIDNPENLYRRAVSETLSHLETDSEFSHSIETLLLHLDNDLIKFESLIVKMLSKRDQWLPYLFLDLEEHALRHYLEDQLKALVSEALLRIKTLFPKEDQQELLMLAKFAGENARQSHAPSLIQYCADLSQLPGTHYEDKHYWLALSELLLTKGGEWRKRFTEKEGFPSVNSHHPKSDKSICSQFKKQMLSLVNRLSQSKELSQALIELNLLPHHSYSNLQWNALVALKSVLKIAVAHLKLIFQKESKIDYIENAQAALISLGNEDNPTDLALMLDYKFKHILVDEFQDTSTTQYQLLEKLTRGWEINDGRTLFIVGDPMQSIYRFREAEVGLFIRSRLNGIGQIKLHPLTLSVNFRSDSPIVDWVNECFATIFPDQDHVGSGAVSYSKSTASRLITDSQSKVLLHPFFDAADYSEQIVSCIQDIKKQKPEYTVAILVRSRTHLSQLIPALKKANMEFQAIDIDPLFTRPVIQDLLALTKALIHPADRVAWLSILRAPSTGLCLNDLLILAQDSTQPILWLQIQSNDLVARLSQEGQERIEKIRSILTSKLPEKDRVSLREWVETTWISLGGPAALTNEIELVDARTYFDLLEKYENEHEEIQFDELNTLVERLFAASDSSSNASLKIMTIHSAKGLEFDAVILPQLEGQSPANKNELLMWQQYPLQNESTALLIAPIHGIGHDKDSIYQFIKYQQTIKNDYESARLLYVAATRAKKQLHLFFNCETKDNAPKVPTNCFLHKLWPAIDADIQKHFLNFKPSHAFTVLEEPKRMIRRLTLSWKSPLAQRQSDIVSLHKLSGGFQLPSNQHQVIGTLIHRILQQLSLQGINWWTSQKNKQHEIYVRHHLSQLGFSGEKEEAVMMVQQAINNTIKDPKGLWILTSNESAEVEYAISASINNELEDLIIDKTFVDNQGIRWIIDYKSTDFKGNDLEQFLKFEKQQHEKQLLSYHLALKEMDSRPIMVGLYFPLIPSWHEWHF